MSVEKTLRGRADRNEMKGGRKGGRERGYRTEWELSTGRRREREGKDRTKRRKLQNTGEGEGRQKKVGSEGISHS